MREGGAEGSAAGANEAVPTDRIGAGRRPAAGDGPESERGDATGPAGVEPIGVAITGARGTGARPVCAKAQGADSKRAIAGNALIP